MRIIRSLAIMALLAVAAQAQEVRFAPNFSVGDSWETTASATMQMAGNKMNMSNTYTVKVLQVNNGMPTQLEVTGGAKNSMGPQPSALAGKTVKVSMGPTGITGEPRDVVQAAQAEIAGLFPATEFAMMPTQPVRVGQEFKPDVTAMLAQMKQPGVDEATGDMTAVVTGLKEVDGRKAAVIKITGNLKASGQGASMSSDIDSTRVVDLQTGKGLVEDSRLLMTMSQGDQTMVIDTTTSSKTTLRTSGARGNNNANANNANNNAGDDDANPFDNPARNTRNNDGNPFDEAPVAEPSKYSGTYSGGDVSLTVQANGANATGTITRGGKTFPFKGKLNGDNLTGSFTAGEQSFDFSARFSGDQVTLKTGSRSFDLKRQAASNPFDN